ncbi:MAG: hypothetical protein DRP67_03550 [Candidatus Omnitrophota bacterium]|nr:MAG: hypothetical protein DRP67_03550 [Candidatus Omnitrophota bacterium]
MRIFIKRWHIYITLCVFFLTVYVLISISLFSIGYKLKELEDKYKELTLINKNKQSEFLKLLSPSKMKEMMSKYNMELKKPEEWRYVEVFKEKEGFISGIGENKAEASTR